MDWTLLVIVLVLTVLGLIMQYSASSYDMSLIIKQGAFAGGGLVAIFVMSLIPARFYYKVSLFVYGAALVLTAGAGLVGKTVKGARRWFELGPITFQPSELLKAGLILSLAMLICKYCNQMNQAEYIPVKTYLKQLKTIDHRKFLRENKGYYIELLLILTAVGVVAMINKDLGTGVIIFVIGFVMLLVSSPRIGWLLLLLGAAFLGIAGMAVAFPYRMGRITAWLHPDQFADDLGYQVREGLYAIGSGGLFGRGLGKSIQKDVIPEPHTDMIYSILCEELGIIGGIVVVVLFVLLLLRLKKNYDQTNDLFGKLVIAGVASHIWIQSFFNMAVLTGVMPNTGVPLPFISYGGTSLLCLLGEIGIVMAVRKTGIDSSAV